MNVVIDDDARIKMKKIDLIQQATTRLRRRQLEEQLLGMMTSMEEIQTQSKHIYNQLSGAMTTTQQLTEYDIGQQHQQMDLLENQVRLLQSMQQQWFPFMFSKGSKKAVDQGISDNEDSFDDDKATSITMSRLSSLSMISSLFSRPVSRATSVSEFTDLDSNEDDYRYSYAAPTSAVLDQQWNQLYRNQRRLRTKNHRKRYQDRQTKKEDQEDVLADLVMANSPTMKHHINTKPVLLSLCKTQQQVSTNIPLPSPPLSPLSSSCRSSLSTCQQTTDYYMYGQEDDTRTDISDYCGSVDHPPKKDSCTVFDDTMDFLEQMDAALLKGDGYDDEFFQDMAFLLDHPELCNQPLADLAPLLEQHHQAETRSRSYDSPHGPSSSPYLKDLCSSGWQWYRFLSVLSASYVVSLLKGPDDLLID